jgi:hypothetical protein
MIWHWFLHVSGANQESGTWYGFWSGFGGSIPDFLILGGFVTYLQQHNCHVQHCWRLRKHAVEGTPYIVCKKHHPGVPAGAVTAESVAAAHKAANG